MSEWLESIRQATGYNWYELLAGTVAAVVALINTAPLGWRVTKGSACLTGRTMRRAYRVVRPLPVPEPPWEPGTLARECLLALQDDTPTWKGEKNDMSSGILTAGGTRFLLNKKHLDGAHAGSGTINGRLHLEGRDYQEVQARVLDLAEKCQERERLAARWMAAEEIRLARLASKKPEVA